MSRSGQGRRWWSIDLVGLACCAALTAGGYVVAVVPVVQSRKVVAGVRSEADAAEARGEQLLQVSRKLDASLAHVRTRLESISLELEPAEQVNRRVNVLTRLASEAGLTLDEVLPGAPESASLYRTVPIRISGTGTYADCAAFLHVLRDDLRDTTVRSLRLVAGPEDPGASTFVFELVWYAAPADHDG